MSAPKLLSMTRVDLDPKPVCKIIENESQTESLKYVCIICYNTLFVYEFTIAKNAPHSNRLKKSTQSL